jgi:hypothetical protein
MVVSLLEPRALVISVIGRVSPDEEPSLATRSVLPPLDLRTSPVLRHEDVISPGLEGLILRRALLVLAPEGEFGRGALPAIGAIEAKTHGDLLSSQ